MKPSDVRDLIAKLKAARGEDRRLDLDIAFAAKAHPYFAETWVHSVRWSVFGDEIDVLDEAGKRRGVLNPQLIPRYTKAVDAALSLVPEGTGALINATLGPWAQVIRDTPEFSGPSLASATAATPALALCVACLKARFP